MKQTFCILTLFFGLLSCSRTEKTNDNSIVYKTADEKIKLHKLEKLFVVGDFDGDGNSDTIFQRNYSRMAKSEIEYSADPFQNEWDTVVNWFYEQDVNIFLKINNHHDSLNLGAAQGLYCLINIGDNNLDGKEEVAFVIDYLDFSSLNSCKIYTLCNDKWTMLKQFNIHEDSFDFSSNKKPIFNNIRYFLKVQNGKWVYKDYPENGFQTTEDFKRMLILKLDKCN